MLGYIQRTITQLNLPEAHFGTLKKHLVDALGELTSQVRIKEGEILVPSLRHALERFGMVLKTRGWVSNNITERQAVEEIARNNGFRNELTAKLYATANPQAHSAVGWSQHTLKANEEALSTTVDIILLWRKSLPEGIYGPALIDEYAGKVSEYKKMLDAELGKQGHTHYVTRRVEFITTHRGDNDEGDEFTLLRRPPDLSMRAHKASGSPGEITLHHLNGRYPEAVVFIASEGMGKTFEVNQLASTLTNITEKRLCVWLPCREISDSGVNSLKLLWGKQAKNFRPYYQDVFNLPNEWKIVLILDGFDEIVDDGCIQAFDTIFEESKSFVYKWGGLVVVTGRDVDSVHNHFDNEFRYALQKFSDEDIVAYLNMKGKGAWLDSLPRQDQRIASFLRIPFFLSALVDANLDDSKLSGLNRATLLNEYLDALLAHELEKIYPDLANTEPEKLKKHLQVLRGQLSQHAVSLTISGIPLEKFANIPLEEITFLINQQQPNTFRHDVVMHFLLAQAIKCELDGNIDKLFNRIAQRTVGTDGTLPLSDAARYTIWSLLLELANNDQHLYPNTIKALCEADPVLVYFGLKDRGRLPENYKHPKIIEWNLFQSGLCKCLLGIDPQPEQDMICDVRLVSPEEVLIARLRDENLRYVATAEAIDAFRKRLFMSPEPWSDLVIALGYETVFGGQHPTPNHEKVVRYAFDFARVGDSGGFTDFETLVTDIEYFLRYLELKKCCTPFELTVLYRTLRCVHNEYFTERDKDQKIQYSKSIHQRLIEVLHDRSNNFCHLTARQVHRLFVGGTLKGFIRDTNNQQGVVSLIQRIQSDKVIDIEVFNFKLSRYKSQREAVKRRLLDVTKNFQQIAVIPPVKLLGVLNYFRGEFHAQSSAIHAWIERWSQKLSSWEVCRLVKCRFNLLDKNDGYVPISIIQSHGWLPGRDAAILAQTHLSPNVKVTTYSAEQKEYWCRFATNKELRDLLDSRVIVRDDEKYFRKIVCILLERSSPVFLRKLFPGDRGTPSILPEDFPKKIKEEWLDAAGERPDYNVACRRLGWIDCGTPISEKVMDLVASQTGYLHERKYFLDNQIVAKEEFWAIEKAWADSIEIVHENLSLHPFLLVYSGVDTRGFHLFTHPWIKTYIKHYDEKIKLGAGKVIEKDSLFCARLKLSGHTWMVSDVYGDLLRCDIQTDHI